jgi:aryl-alcohol dehydrogenase-like predicted oxidoreductase
VLAIPGTSSVAHLEENLAAGRLALDDEDLAALQEV